jgi:hypothetical protein
VIAVRVLLWSVIGAALFALLGVWGHRLTFSRLEAHGEVAFYVLGVAGAFIGGIAAAAQSIVDQFRKNQTSGAR